MTMHTEVSDELYYQNLIKLYGKKILISVAFIILIAVGFELRSHYIEKDRIIAQELFESYIDQPSEDVLQRLQTQHPSSIHAQLSSLLAAKYHFVAENFDETERQLTFVIQNSPDTEIKSIAITRLSSLYRSTNQNIKAQQVLQEINQHTSYSKYLEAMALPKHSDERTKALDEAMALSPSPYLKQMIILGQYNNIGDV
ncbi:MAG: tetratricopeptide repeat protein [Pseudomonadota bacterium]|nr:tetratricopeptide repeat protein [Pseudomonadota bacterium]